LTVRRRVEHGEVVCQGGAGCHNGQGSAQRHEPVVLRGPITKRTPRKERRFAGIFREEQRAKHCDAREQNPRGDFFGSVARGEACHEKGEQEGRGEQGGFEGGRWQDVAKREHCHDAKGNEKEFARGWEGTDKEAGDKAVGEAGEDAGKEGCGKRAVGASVNGKEVKPCVEDGVGEDEREQGGECDERERDGKDGGVGSAFSRGEEGENGGECCGKCEGLPQDGRVAAGRGEEAVGEGKPKGEEGPAE
jgi:hypothetical protein